MLHVCTYLDKCDQYKLVLDPLYVDHGEELHMDWRCFYPNAKEELPADAPKPLRNGIQTTEFIDSEQCRDIDLLFRIHGNSHLSQQSTNHMVWPEAEECRDIDLLFRIYGT